MLFEAVKVAHGGVDFCLVRSSRFWQSWCRCCWSFAASSKCVSACRPSVVVLGVLQKRGDVPSTDYALEARLLLRLE